MNFLHPQGTVFHNGIIKFLQYLICISFFYVVRNQMLYAPLYAIKVFGIFLKVTRLLILYIKELLQSGKMTIFAYGYICVYAKQR